MAYASCHAGKQGTLNNESTRPMENANVANRKYAQKTVNFDIAKKANICLSGFPRTVKLNGNAAKSLSQSLQGTILKIRGWKGLRWWVSVEPNLFFGVSVKLKCVH
jgi:hypothetical protein